MVAWPTAWRAAWLPPILGHGEGAIAGQGGFEDFAPPGLPSERRDPDRPPDLGGRVAGRQGAREQSSGRRGGPRPRAPRRYCAPGPVGGARASGSGHADARGSSSWSSAPASGRCSTGVQGVGGASSSASRAPLARGQGQGPARARVRGASGDLTRAPVGDRGQDQQGAGALQHGGRKDLRLCVRGRYREGRCVWDQQR